MDILIPASEERAMSDDDLAHHISQELTKAHGTYESDQKHARFKGMRYYYGQLPRAPEKPRSGIRSTDIADVCDALIADILPMFSGKSSLAQFDAQNARDQYAAAEESKAVNYIFFEKCNGARFIRDMLQDGLLQRNATAQVEVVEDLKTETREYGPVTEQELALYMQNHVATRPNEALEVIGGTDYQDDGTVNQGDTSTVTLRRTWVERTLEVTAHAPENVFVCADHDSLDLSDARFVAFRVTPTRSDLVELGVPYDIAYNELPAYAQSRDYDKIARDRVSDTTAVRASHKSGEQVECYRCFYHIDVDGDGIAELHEVLYSRSKHILSDEIIDYSGLACFSPWPIAHKWVGTGIVDKLESIVEGKTVFLRQTIDNLIRVNNQRLVCVEGKVDPSSVENSDPLAPIWVTNVNDVQALAFPNAGGVGFQMLEYLDKIRRERVGSALDIQASGSQNQMVPGDTAHGAERVMTMLEKQAAQIAANLSYMLQDVFRCMHRLLRTSDYGDFSYAVDGEMQMARPSTWPERTNVTVKLGLSEGQRLQKLAALEATYQKQTQLSQAAPGVLVSPANMYTTLVEQASVAGLDSPERFWVNPSSPQAQQQMQQQQMQQRAAMQAQQAAQERTLRLQEELARSTAQNEELKIRLKAVIDSRKQRLDEIEALDESSRAWTELEIEANKDLNERGRFL